MILPPTGHELLTVLPLSQLLSTIDGNASLRGYLQGYVSEKVLENLLHQHPSVRSVEKIRDHDSRKGDLLITLHSGAAFTIEAKTGRPFKQGKNRRLPVEGGEIGSVNLKNTGSSNKNGRYGTFLHRGKFDVLAINMRNITGAWEYYFILNKYLPLSTHSPAFLAQYFPINTTNTPFLRSNISDIIRDLG